MQTPDVIIIGAGAAGLAAADELSRKGARVLILEARERIGGRCWTRRVPGLPIPVELGAEFIHGEAKVTHALLRRAGLTAVEWVREQRASVGGRLLGSCVKMLMKRMFPLRADHRCDVFQHRNDGAFNRRRRLTARACLSIQRFADSCDGCPYAFVSGCRRTIQNSAGAEAKLENVTSSYGCNRASYRDSYIDKRHRGAHADSSASRVEAASRLAKTREDDSQSSKGQGGCNRREIP